LFSECLGLTGEGGFEVGPAAIPPASCFVSSEMENHRDTPRQRPPGGSSSDKSSPSSARIELACMVKAVLVEWEEGGELRVATELARAVGAATPSTATAATDGSRSWEPGRGLRPPAPVPGLREDGGSAAVVFGPGSPCPWPLRQVAVVSFFGKEGGYRAPALKYRLSLAAPLVFGRGPGQGGQGLVGLAPRPCPLLRAITRGSPVPIGQRGQSPRAAGASLSRPSGPCWSWDTRPSGAAGFGCPGKSRTPRQSSASSPESGRRRPEPPAQVPFRLLRTGCPCTPVAVSFSGASIRHTACLSCLPPAK